MKQFAITVLRVALFVSLIAANPAHASDNRLVIGVIPEMNLLKQMERYTPLAKYLTMKLGIPVELKPLSNYGRMYEKMRDGEIDAGFFGSFVYALSRARLGIEPIARPQATNGISAYSGVTFARKNSSLKTAEDFRGKTIALVDPATTAGYLAQKHYLQSLGVDLDKEMKILWMGSHDEVISAVLQHQAALGGVKSSMLQRMRRDNKAFEATIEILDERPKHLVPENTLAVRHDLNPVLTMKLKHTLLTMHRDDVGRDVLARFGATRFLETRDSDYRSLYKLIDHLKIDLKTYSYQRP
jgi:phosphonate transport system substrate-binding protein